MGNIRFVVRRRGHANSISPHGYHLFMADSDGEPVGRPVGRFDMNKCGKVDYVIVYRNAFG